MTPEQKLQALFSAQNPPPQDYGFDIAVLERIARQRAISRFTHMAMFIAVTGGLFSALVWSMETGRTASLVLMLAAIGACAVAALVVWTMERARAF